MNIYKEQIKPTLSLVEKTLMMRLLNIYFCQKKRGCNDLGYTGILIVA